jgi:hypothetical protein
MKIRGHVKHNKFYESLLHTVNYETLFFYNRNGNADHFGSEYPL